MARNISYIFGAITAIAGIWGFLQNPVLGIFGASAATSTLWLITGVVVLAVALWMPEQNSLALKVFGVIYLIVAVLGFVGYSLVGLDTGMADNVLHVVLALAFLYGGFMAKGSAPAMSSAPMGNNPMGGSPMQ